MITDYDKVRGEMERKYPLFILAQDDRSLYKINCKRDLDWFEKIDIEDGLYCGWDKDGYPIKIIWSLINGAEVEIVEEKSRLEDLKNAVLNYAREYAPKLVFEKN